ncbi:MAG: hypothetical protein ACX94B_04320 [Henriciella sp.]
MAKLAYIDPVKKWGIVISNLHEPGRVAKMRHQIDRDELSIIADYLDVLRQFTPHSPAISSDTSEELQQYLALAEAALRRALAEIRLADDDSTVAILQ